MSDLLTQADIARIREAYPDLNVEPLTSQQERAALGVCRGLSVAQSARSVGMTPLEIADLKENESFLTTVDYLKNVKYGIEQTEIVITRDTISLMFLEAHRKAATATEEISATRELAKLHDLYLDAQRKSGVTVNINPADITSEKQLESMDDGDLIELTGDDFRLASETEVERG